jgi:alkanesulfonate monooxygenase SsuD/methylene tetrahydromethanopterin reductase-like flavin-dependent oxidoreductase (luciferase family)
MRYALMTEPQQGLHYDELLALVRTAEEAGIEAFFRSDHYASFPGEEGLHHHRRLGDPCRPRSGDDAHPARDARVAGHLPHPRQPRQGDPDRRRDGGRSDRGGVRCRMERGRACSARHPVPADRRALRHARGADGDPPRLWTDPEGWSFEGVTGRCGMPAATASGPRRPPSSARHLRRQGRSRMARLVAKYGDEFNLISASAEEAPAAYRRVREACTAEGRDPDRSCTRR